MSRRTLGTVALILIAAVTFGGLGLAASTAATTPTPKPKVVRGPAGPAGPQGQPGERGLPGRDGRDGAAGPMGPQGIPGENGRAGDNGRDGADGADGFTLPSGTVLLIAGECPSGTTVQGNPLQWRVYNGNPFTGSGSELYASACRFN